MSTCQPFQLRSDLHGRITYYIIVFSVVVTLGFFPEVHLGAYTQLLFSRHVLIIPPVCRVTTLLMLHLSYTLPYYFSLKVMICYVLRS